VSFFSVIPAGSRRVSAVGAAVFCASVAGVVPARAVTLPGFDHAIPQAPQKLELGGGAAGGDDLVSVFALARFGLLDDLDLASRAGFVGGLGAGDGNGFEVAVGPRFRFIRTEDTGFIDAAVLADVGVVKTENLFVLGLDPTFVASHEFVIDGRRAVYVSLGLGVAFSVVDADGAGGGTDLESGFMGAFSTGVDVIEDLRLSLEARLRDEIQRYGLALTYQF
jgi:hypothetical protein